MNIIELHKKANVIREHIVQMAHDTKSAHIAPSLSCTDILVTLYFHVLKGQDHFILSKGHGCMALYATLAEKGVIPVEWLGTYHMNGGKLMGHPSHLVPGIEWSTGSLGHGVSVGVGLAMAQKIKKGGGITFVVIGDGECNEGGVWEAAMLASQQKLNNLVVIADCNGFQATSKCNEVDPSVLRRKWESFGWEVLETDGNDIGSLIGAFDFIDYSRDKICPIVLIAHTVKGKGVSFMENDLEWHYKSPNDEELVVALKEIRGKNA
jgi:transketolase